MTGILLAGLIWVGAEPAVGAAPVPAPPAPPILLLDPAELAPQPVYGPLLPVWPAHRLALMEAGQPIPSNDPRVGQEAETLAALTAVYVEDAPRIAELTVRVCQQVRATNRPASPDEMLAAARAWRPRPSSRPGVFRAYEEFAARYRELRVKGGKSHEEAAKLLLESGSR